MGVFEGTTAKITRFMQKYGGTLLEVCGSLYIKFENPAMTKDKIEKFRKLLVRKYAYGDRDPRVSVREVRRIM